MNQYAPDVTILHIESHKLDHNGLQHNLGQSISGTYVHSGDCLHPFVRGSVFLR